MFINYVYNIPKDNKLSTFNFARAVSPVVLFSAVHLYSLANFEISSISFYSIANTKHRIRSYLINMT